MRSGLAWSGCAALAVLLMAGNGRTAGLRGTGQSSGGLQQTSPTPMPGVRTDAGVSGVPGPGAGDPYSSKMAAMQARAVRDDRHKKLVEDTAKLVALS
ncbi:MAG: hypothetical protein V4555_13420, partial [Acidobacteriota bacterium]